MGIVSGSITPAITVVEPMPQPMQAPVSAAMHAGHAGHDSAAAPTGMAGMTGHDHAAAGHGMLSERTRPNPADFSEADVQIARDLRSASEKTARARFSTPKKAAAAGWTSKASPAQLKAKPVGSSVHYTNKALLADGKTLDPNQPESIMYTKLADGTWALSGVMYRDTTDAPTPTFAGGFGNFHSHRDGGLAAATTGGMMHVWFANDIGASYMQRRPKLSELGYPNAARKSATHRSPRAGH